MRVVFLGTPEFAVPALRMLLDHSYEIRGVYTQPDRPSGRGQKPKASSVKLLAQSMGIPIFQPQSIREDENRRILERLNPDFIVVAAYGQILPGWLLQSAHQVPVNIHASLLPRYRGAAPIPWAILNGDRITGVTTMAIREKLDSGPILLQQEIPISSVVTAGELTADLSIAGANLLIKTLDGLRKHAICPREQDESQVSWAPRITKDMARICWAKRSHEIHNQIRALNPRPTAQTVFRGEVLKIWRSWPENHIADSWKPPGTLLGLSREGIRVQCGEGTILELLELQMPGRDRVGGRAFAAGRHIMSGESLSSIQD